MMMKKQAVLLLLIVLLDASLKVAAFALLPANSLATADCFLCFELRVNYLNVGSAAQSVMAGQASRLIAVALFDAAVAVALLRLKWKRTLTFKSVCIAVVVASVLCVTALILGPTLNHFSFLTAAIAARIAQTGLWLVIWALASSPIWKLGALMLSMAGVSNTLSFIYPPFHVVDYLWSAPMSHALGVGVFNLADLIVLAAYPVFAAALLWSAYGWITTPQVSEVRT